MATYRPCKPSRFCFACTATLQLRKWIADKKGKGHCPQEFPAMLETAVWARFQVELARMCLVDFGDMLQVGGRRLVRGAGGAEEQAVGGLGLDAMLRVLRGGLLPL